MKVLILYRPNSEYARSVEEFIHDYKAKYPDAPIETISLDTKEGSATATLYDVVRYPAILIVQNSGSLQKTWEGPDLPRFDDVESYMHS